MPVDGGVNYYGSFSHGLPTNPSYFPVGVWFESVRSQADVDKDKGAGLQDSDGVLVRPATIDTFRRGDRVRFW